MVQQVSIKWSRRVLFFALCVVLLSMVDCTSPTPVWDGGERVPELASRDDQSSAPDTSITPDEKKGESSAPDSPTAPDTSIPDAAPPEPKMPQEVTLPEPPSREQMVRPEQIIPEPPAPDKAPPRATIKVGPKERLKKPSEAAKIAKNGDVIDIAAGEYSGDVAFWKADNLLIRGVGGRAHLKAAGRSAGGKAIWVIQGDNTMVENIEFSGTVVKDKNGAGIRQEGTNLTIRNCYFHDNENGILTGFNANSTILIEYSIFERNGDGRGYAHNMYIGHIKHFILRHSYTSRAKVGHNVKSRAARNDILYNRISDERTGTSSYSIDLPNGGRSFIIGNVIQQSATTSNSTVVSYGAEGLKRSQNELYFVNNTVVSYRNTSVFLNIRGGTPKAVSILNNIFFGAGSFTKKAAWDIRNNLATRKDPGFVGASAFNYRLKANSAAKDKGVNAGSKAGMSLSATYQYVHTAKRRVRANKGKPDLGAFEGP